MKCDECNKQLSSVTEYEDYHIQCRACFDRYQVMSNEDPNHKVEWIGQKKFTPGTKSDAHLCKVNPRGVGDICVICNKVLNDTEEKR